MVLIGRRRPKAMPCLATARRPPEEIRPRSGSASFLIGARLAHACPQDGGIRPRGAVMDPPRSRVGEVAIDEPKAREALPRKRQTRSALRGSRRLQVAVMDTATTPTYPGADCTQIGATYPSRSSYSPPPGLRGRKGFGATAAADHRSRGLEPSLQGRAPLFDRQPLNVRGEGRRWPWVVSENCSTGPTWRRSHRTAKAREGSGLGVSRQTARPPDRQHASEGRQEVAQP